MTRISGHFLGTLGTSVLNVDIRDNFVSPNSLSAIDIVAEGVTGEVTDRVSISPPTASSQPTMVSCFSLRLRFAPTTS